MGGGRVRQYGGKGGGGRQWGGVSGQNEDSKEEKGTAGMARGGDLGGRGEG